MLNAKIVNIHFFSRQVKSNFIFIYVLRIPVSVNIINKKHSDLFRI